MANIGYVKNVRSALRPGTSGVLALTTVPQLVLGPPITGDTRWVLGGSRVYNRSNENSGNVAPGPASFSLYYVPIGETPGLGHIFDGGELDAGDSRHLGEFPMVPGYEIHASASDNGYLSIIPFFEEIE